MKSNACNTHCLPWALSGKVHSVLHSQVPAKVPERTLIGTGWFPCSFLNQSPCPGRGVWCSSWASLVDTQPWSWRVEVDHRDWEWGGVFLAERAVDALEVKTITVRCDVVWPGGFEGPIGGNPWLSAHLLRWFLPVWFPIKYLSCWHGPPAILLLDIGRACRAWLINSDLTWKAGQALCPRSPPTVTSTLWA